MVSIDFLCFPKVDEKRVVGAAEVPMSLGGASKLENKDLSVMIAGYYLPIAIRVFYWQTALCGSKNG
jgi:hypothetical protein